MIKNNLIESGEVITLAVGQTYTLKDNEVFINNSIYLKKDLKVSLAGNSENNNSNSVSIGIKKREGLLNLPADLVRFNEWAVNGVQQNSLANALENIQSAIYYNPATGGGGGNVSEWGDLTGDINNQTDLINLINQLNSTFPVENEYTDINSVDQLLADQANQTFRYFQYVIDASDDPNVTENVGATNPFEAYYEKLNTTTGAISDYRLLSDTETQTILDSNGYRVFRIREIQDDSTPVNTTTGGRISFNYNTVTNKATSIVFNRNYSDSISTFYDNRNEVDYKIKFYNRNTREYEFAEITAWTQNGDFFIVDITNTIDINNLSVNDRIELFFDIDVDANASSEGQRRRAVINLVDKTQAPPTEANGNRYILDFTAGGVNAAWDGASAGDIVEFDGTDWNAETPEEGWAVYVDDQDNDYRYVDDGTPAWEVVSGGSGGGTELAYQTPIVIDTSYNSSTAEINKIIPVEADDIVATINKGTWATDEILIFEPRGSNFKIEAGSEARIYGERNVNNEHICRNPHTLISVSCIGLNGSIMEFVCQGAKKLGYTGAVTTSSYSTLAEGDVGTNVTVIGTGFSANMEDPIVSANGTLNSWTYVSANEITLNMDAVGAVSSTITITYRNPDLFVDTNAITIATASSLPNDLVRWYKFEETSGTTATDTQGNSDGTYTGGITLNQTGQVNLCPLFNGTSGVVDYGATENWGITADGWTISSWIRKTALSQVGIIFSKTSTFFTIQAQVNTSGDLIVIVGDNTGSANSDKKQWTFNGVISASVWYSLVIRFTDVNTIDVRLDNVSLTPSATAGTAPSVAYATGSFEIGAKSTISFWWDGDIDEVCAWTRVLTDAECLEKYTEENAGNPMFL